MSSMVQYGPVRKPHQSSKFTEKEREKKRKEKDIMKSLETPEEKRARRLAKKDAKSRRQLEKFGWDQNDLAYTSVDNPFGDKALFNKFLWRKKREKEARKLKLDEKDLDKLDLKRRKQMKLELEKAKQRRQEREREKMENEKEREAMQRMKESELFGKWAKEEDEFHLNQSKVRTQIRIESGRAKPIDLLIKYISAVFSADSTEERDLEMQEPYLLLRGLNQIDLDDLLEDIRYMIKADEGRYQGFWKDMHIVCEEELKKLCQLHPSHPDYESADRRGGINKAVSSDVSSIFKGKTHAQLLVVQGQIQAKLSSREAVDTGFWDALQLQLHAAMARARLRDGHQATLERKLYQLRQEESDGILSSNDAPTQPILDSERTGPSGQQGWEQAEPDSVLDEKDILQSAHDDYMKGCYSPKLLRGIDIEEELVVDPAEDADKLAAGRRLVLAGEVGEGNEDDKGRGVVRQRGEERTMEEEDEFNSQFELAAKAYTWQDKYKPRKPRFLNRVHTGYEWNKYNQTHYDHDNPPPKIVQGYKFNIFYPDLIDKRKTPEFFLESCQGSSDFSVLRFHAGPPYEDIAFKIVNNREWECSWKKGFRSQYSNNIFQLWFRFKRDRYRR